ncbi:MAG: hypothetical protein IJA06_08810 [Oscillospiraceae bacterium]|nr:hypothetical protein [Oscillospiraceae bacterium]
MTKGEKSYSIKFSRQFIKELPVILNAVKNPYSFYGLPRAYALAMTNAGADIIRPFSPAFSEKSLRRLAKNYLFANKNLALSSKTDILYIWNKERRGIYEYQP